MNRRLRDSTREDSPWDPREASPGYDVDLGPLLKMELLDGPARAEAEAEAEAEAAEAEAAKVEAGGSEGKED